MSCQFFGQLSDTRFFLADQTTFKFYSFNKNEVSVITSYKISSSQNGIAFYKNLNEEQIYLSFNYGSTFYKNQIKNLKLINLFVILKVGRANNLYELRYCDQTPLSDVAFNDIKMGIVICTSGLLITSTTQVFTMINCKYDSYTLWTAFNLLETTFQQFGNGISYQTGSTLKIYSNFPTIIQWKLCYPICLSCDLIDQCTEYFQGSNRVLLNGSCICQKGYYQDQNNNCVKCKSNCLECTPTDICTLCDSQLNRILSYNDCICQQGYYDDLPNLFCFQKGSCPTSCLNCDNLGYQFNQSTQSCDSICQPPCQLCTPGTNQCQICMQDYFFQKEIAFQTVQISIIKIHLQKHVIAARLMDAKYAKHQLVFAINCYSQCPSGFAVQTLNEDQRCQDVLTYYDIYQEKDNQININFQSSGSIDIDLLYLNLNLSRSDKIAAYAISSTAQATSKVTQAAIIPLQLSGNFRFITSLVDISQIIYVMHFLQIDWINLAYLIDQTYLQFLILERAIALNMPMLSNNFTVIYISKATQLF
ncbi:hypothetical protein ABPG72_019543 [Tetrahymena utriculariae]